MRQGNRLRHLAALLACLVISSLLACGVAGSQTRGPAGIADDPARTKPLSFQVNYVYRPGGAGPLQPLAEGAVLHSGDHYKIQFTPQEDSYVYIFQIDSRKRVDRLFPMASFQGVTVNNRNPVRAGVTYTLPAADKAFQLDDQRGQETLYFLAARQPGRELEQQYEALSQARQQHNADLASRLQAQLTRSLKGRGLAAIVPDPAPSAGSVPWDGQRLDAPSQRLENLGADRVSVVTFEHR